MRRTTIITGPVATALASIAVGVAVVAPATAAPVRQPVTRAEVSTVTHRLAEQSAAKIEARSATGIEDLTNGAARVDRSRTSVGNYLRYGKFRMGASFAVFGTNTVNGEARTLWCVGYVEVVRAKSGRTRVAPGNLLCPVS
jgi:hypothetical protein